MVRHPQGAAGTKTSTADRGSGPYRPQTAGLWSRRRRDLSRARAGEVLVTRGIADAAGAHLELELIGEVRLKGLSEATELFLARPRAK